MMNCVKRFWMANGKSISEMTACVALTIGVITARYALFFN